MKGHEKEIALLRKVFYYLNKRKTISDLASKLNEFIFCYKMDWANEMELVNEVTNEVDFQVLKIKTTDFIALCEKFEDVMYKGFNKDQKLFFISTIEILS